MAEDIRPKDPMVWHPVYMHRPKLTKQENKDGALGRQVLIWPPYRSEGAADAHVAFYGRRVTNEPNFYIYGRVINVTHWMPLPEGPR